VRSYRLSKIADADLLSIFRYTLDTWGEDQLRIYLELFETARDLIVENPFRPGSKPREDLAPGCHTFRTGKHYLVYRVNGTHIEIARILHESMDFETQVTPADFP